MNTSTRMAAGVISPKVKIPTLILVAAGAILGVLDATGILDVQDELWLALLGAAGVTGGAGYAAEPGPVDETPAARRPGIQNERGYSLVEVAFALLIVIIALAVLFAIL